MTFGDKRVREFLCYCFPALIVGLTLRLIITLQMPYAYYHEDAPDFLESTEKYLENGNFSIHPKKTFLTPILFSIPLLLKISPALMAIPIAQHLLGLLLVIMIGALCRLWFVHWKWFIIPVTLLIAVDPAIIWYEHALMAECQYLSCAALLALVGTLYANRNSWARFAMLCVALFLIAGARPEGKLFFAFGLLLVLFTAWGKWRHCLLKLAILIALGLVTNEMTKTRQSGLLLYTSVVHLTPDNLRAAPGFGPFIQPLRDELREQWSHFPAFAKVKERRRIAEIVSEYFKAYPEMGMQGSKKDIDDLCKKMAMETCLRQSWRLPSLVVDKFRATATASPSGRFDEFWLQKWQFDSYIANWKMLQNLSGRLAKRSFDSEEEVAQFIQDHYKPEKVKWFDRWDNAWDSTLKAFRLPDTNYEDYVLRGVPWLFLIAGVGMLASLARSGTIHNFHMAWIPTLAAIFFIIILTANIKPRFRFVFEPFWFLYFFVLLDTIWLGMERWHHKKDNLQSIRRDCEI